VDKVYFLDLSAIALVVVAAIALAVIAQTCL